MLAQFQLFNQPLTSLGVGKLLINTINAHSFNLAQNDKLFNEALLKSDVLLPDGISVVMAMRWLKGIRLTKIAGADLFFYEMNRLDTRHKTQDDRQGKAFFLGSSESTLAKIKERAAREYPNVEISTYSPPFKAEFSDDENRAMLDAINAFEPDVLFIGMTAPKQEKWAYTHFDRLPNCHVCSIGAVFDFYAGTIRRVPRWMLQLGLEWLYRLIREPRRLWRRYLIGNTRFVFSIIREKVAS